MYYTAHVYFCAWGQHWFQRWMYLITMYAVLSVIMTLTNWKIQKFLWEELEGKRWPFEYLYFLKNNFLQCLVKSSQTLKFVCPGNTIGGKYHCTVDLLFDCMESAVWLLKFFVFICKIDSSKPVKQEVNGTVIRPPVVFPGVCFAACRSKSPKEGIFQMKIYGDLVPVL